MTLITDKQLPFMKKYFAFALRGVFLVTIAVGLSACGGDGANTVNALTSLGSSGSVADNSTNTTTTASTGSTPSTGSTLSSNTTPAPVPVAVSVSLSWNAPSTRIDNTAISPSDIGGYHVYFGSDSSNLQLLTDINDPSITDYSTQALSAGTYYFAVSAYDSTGAEGRLSNIAQKVIS